MGREVWLTISSLQDICLKSGLKKRRWGARLENDLGFSVFPSENANALKERREVILPILGAGWIMRFQLHFCLLFFFWSVSFFLIVFHFILLTFCLWKWSSPYWVVAGLCDCWIWFSQNCLQRSWLLACRQLANPPWWKLLPLSESDFVNPNAYQSPQTRGYGNSQFRAEIAWIWSSDAISVVGNQMIRRDPHKAFGESMSTLNRHQRMKKHGFLTRNNIRR